MLFVIGLVIASVASPVWGADEEFVGVLAVAVEDEVAEKLGLSKNVHEQLLDLVDERETDALDMAMRLRDVPTEERVQKLAPFRKQSEELGLKILTAEQRETLAGIQLGRRGIASLADADVAKRMKLTQEQRDEVAALIAKRDTALNGIGGKEAKQTREKFGRELKAVLNPAQLVMWKGLTNPDSLVSNSSDAIASKQKNTTWKKGFVKQATNTKNGATNTDAASGMMRFSFRFAPWSTVIEWFANESDLSLLMDAPPQGTFNYSDPRDYTPAQAIDLLNSVLLTKGYTLVRREQMLMVVNLEDGIPPNLITEVAVEDLDSRGEYELAKCLFTLRGVSAEDAAEEIGRLIGPQGKVNVLASSNQLQITETAGRLRTFRKILEAGERKGGVALNSATLIQLKHVRANDILDAWRKLMGLTEEDNVSVDGTMRLAKGKTSKQLIVSGEANRVEEVQDLVELLDVPVGGGNVMDTPQLEVYPITEADPASVLSVMQELFVDVDEMRLAIDATSGNLVALATPEEHAIIRATVKQMQADPRQVEVIKLRTVDPQLAMLSIEKLFGIGEEAEDAPPNPNTPRVDADPISRSLLIRASEAQINDIRSLLVKMGEQDSSSADGDRSLTSGRGNLRMIPIDAATARRAMERMNTIWPTVRGNRIRTVTPSSSIRSSRTGVEVTPSSESGQKTNEPTTRSDDGSVESRLKTTSRYVVAQQQEGVEEKTPESDASLDSNDRGDLPEVIVTLGEQGLLIASEDTKALDEFEELFMTLADDMFAGSRQMTIFYLKYAKAEVASEMLKQFITGGASSDSGGGGTLLGSLAGAALGNSGIGSMLGLGGGGGGGSARISSGTTIIADPRLNAVVVQATPKELDFIQELLKTLDRSHSPERIETIPRPRAIPVLNTDAEAVAEVVRSVYATRLAGGAGQQQKQPSPEDFIRAMSGQKNSNKSISNSIQDQVNVNISVDKRRNALLVVAPNSLFEEIKELVAELDFATPELAETIRYGRASGSSPELIRRALASMGINEVDEAETSQSTSSKKSSNPTNNNRSSRPGMEEMKRSMDFFKAIQARNAKEQAARKKAAKTRSKK